MKSYRFLEHATDAIIEVRSDTVQNAFLAAADAAADLTIDKNCVDDKESVLFEARGENMHHLLYSWLEEIIFVLITRGFAIRYVTIEAASLPGSMDADFNDLSGTAGIGNDKADIFYIRAKAHGETIDLRRHGFKVEIKAPTFHDMVISKSDGQVLMKFLLDL